MFRLLLCAAFFAVAAAQSSGAEPVWIDTDVAIGSPIREVDDAYGLVVAFHSPELRLVGISTSYGNASLPSVDRVAREMVSRFGGPAHVSDREVHSGANRASDRGIATAATQALAAALRKERLTYIAIGPLTNLATLLQLHPQLASRLKRVVFLGGTLPGERLTFGRTNAFTIHDANVFKDPVSVDLVLRSGVPVWLVPITTAGHLKIDAQDLREMGKGPAASRYLSQRSNAWLWFWKTLIGAGGGPLFDAVPVISTVRPGLLSCDTRYARITQAGALLVASKRKDGARPVRYGVMLKPGAKAFFEQRLNKDAP